MKLLAFPLAVLLFFAMFNVLFEFSGSDVYDDFMSASDIQSSDNITVYESYNETDTPYTIEGYTYSAGFDLETGFIALLVGAVALVAVLGIGIFGSGLGGYSVSVIFKSLVYFGIWGLLSFLGAGGLLALPLFGWIFFFILTFIFSLGVMEQLGSS